LANDLGLDLRFIDPVIEDYFGQENAVDWPSPDLCWHQAQRITADYYANLAASAPVALSGQGGDPLLKKNYSYMPDLARKGKWITWAKEFIAYRRMHGHRPPLGIQTAIRRKFQTSDAVSVPNWINPDFAREQQMFDRLRSRAESRRMMLSNLHPYRPEAWHLLSSPYWQFVIPGHDSQVTGQPLEFRHPFFDVRLISFLMRLPSPRWFHQKAILRKAMAAELPAYITQRPKHVFSKNTLKPALLALNEAEREKISSRVRNLSEFVDWKVYARLSGQLKSLTAAELELLMAPVYLADWTNQIARPPENLGEHA
jgi:asparagine synthase (glutamine-hydrolysing)